MGHKPKTLKKHTHTNGNTGNIVGQLQSKMVEKHQNAPHSGQIGYKTAKNTKIFHKLRQKPPKMESFGVCSSVRT